MRNEIKYKVQCMEENRILKTNPKHSYNVIRHKKSKIRGFT